MTPTDGEVLALSRWRDAQQANYVSEQPGAQQADNPEERSSGHFGVDL